MTSYTHFEAEGELDAIGAEVAGSRLRGRDIKMMEKQEMDQVVERPTALYLEDLHIGQRFTSGLYHMDESGIKAFAAEFDPQLFHLDEAVAQTSIFRGLSASGWHTAAV